MQCRSLKGSSRSHTLQEFSTPRFAVMVGQLGILPTTEHQQRIWVRRLWRWTKPWLLPQLLAQAQLSDHLRRGIWPRGSIGMLQIPAVSRLRIGTSPGPMGLAGVLTAW